MKILFETYGGKKVNKNFETAKDAKEYLLRNKSFIKEAQIMEGPLGSGGWTPKKAYNQFVKGRKKLNDKIDMDKVKDSYENNIFDYLINIASKAGEDVGMKNNFGAGRDKHGYYIGALTNGYKKFKL